MDCPFENIEQEYSSDEGELCKKLNGLNVSDRRMLIVYAETKSLAKTAEMFNTSRWSIHRRINKIRELLK